MYVQFGAGQCGPDDWNNYDASPTLWVQSIPILGRFAKYLGPTFPRTVKFGNIVRGLPVPPQSCDAIYCSHVLEHLSLMDLRRSLSNTFMYLRPGGRFRLVMPDLETLANDYITDPSPDAAITFMEQSYLGVHSRPRGIVGLLRWLLGNSSHLWMWDFKSMEAELGHAGFRGIRRATFNDSEESRFRSVESLEMWHRSLAIECIRPRSS